jgi:hypothetical protein
MTLLSMFIGPDHSIRESLLMIATLTGFFTHMKSKTTDPSFVLFYFVVMLCLPALLISYKTW